jgi:hypothetical protein
MPKIRPTIAATRNDTMMDHAVICVSTTLMFSKRPCKTGRFSTHGRS